MPKPAETGGDGQNHGEREQQRHITGETEGEMIKVSRREKQNDEGK